ncbi:MAG: murein biosynthesis integral membrane protein MurJ [Candidatus Moranbacteria bacterium]|nr:murein biosynthesis integral membrane protein MurJ [Candidatus Moranbacteria bacterium]
MLNSKVKQSSTLQKNALTIGFFSLISSFLGLLRDRFLASNFGASEALDIYYGSFKLPDLVFNILIFGIVSSAFVPIFSRQLKKNPRKAKKLTGTALNLVLLSIISVSLVCILLAPVLLKVIVPGFTGDKFETTVNLTRILFLSQILLSVSSIFSGVLATRRKFLIYSLAPIMYNLGIISGIYFFTPDFGVYGLGIAVVLGAFLHMLIQFPFALKNGFTFSKNFKLPEKIHKEIKRLFIPRGLSLIVNQLNILFVTMIGSTLIHGSLAVFNLANNLAQIPLTIFGAPFAIAAFTDLSFLYNKKDLKQFRKVFSNTLIKISFFVVPTTVIMLSLRAQLVRLVLGAGKFDWQDTEITFQILGFLVLGLFFQSTIPLVTRSFFAMQNTLIPFLCGFFSAIINLVLSISLADEMGIAGIALAFSIAQAVNLITMLLVLYIKLDGFEDYKIYSVILKIVISSLIMGTIIQLFKYFTANSWDLIIESFKGYIQVNTLEAETFIKIFFQTGVSALLGVFVYLWVSWYIGIKEASVFIEKLKNLKK